jgi:hypothetical protein
MMSQPLFRERDRKRDLSANLVATSAHLPYFYLEQIAALHMPQSKFIRDAVGEKLERETGFLAAIERTEGEILELKKILAEREQEGEELKVKRSAWLTQKLRARAREAMLAAYLSAPSRPSSLDEFLEVGKTKLQEEDLKLPEVDVLSVAKDLWTEFGRRKT